MSGASITAEPPVKGAPPGDSGRWRRYGVAALFLAPAAFFLVVWIIYPAIYTIVQSLYRGSGFGDFAGLDNYKTLVGRLQDGRLHALGGLGFLRRRHVADHVPAGT